MYIVQHKCANAVYKCMSSDISSLGKVPQKYFHSLTKIFDFWKGSFPLFLCIISYMDSNLRLNQSVPFQAAFLCFQIIYPLLLAFLLISLWLPSNLNQCVLNFLFRIIIEKYLFFVFFLLSLPHSFPLFLLHSLIPSPLFPFITILSKNLKGVIEDRSL